MSGTPSMPDSPGHLDATVHLNRARLSHIQRYIPGPIFVLNDFLQAGRDYTRDFVQGLSGIGMKNPIGFEFFKPPHEEFYEFLDAHLPDWSVEISVESHDDSVRAAFGKSHYSMKQIEETGAELPVTARGAYGKRRMP